MHHKNPWTYHRAAKPGADTCAFPSRQAHVRQSAIRAAGDQLGGGLAVDGVMHLVLHRGEKLLSERLARVVIHARGALGLAE
ncbi:hypothetical protein OW715_07335 [Acidithiobacillus ferriphilus]|uniref:Uncharacterized protein n=1 Tax=Acidithiobacillus ferrooxidans TaxID=920 RepID=A0A179BFW2_ACIFR|nr:hypothetical protein [Acidithiobacillus ferriphilus]MDA8181621.1 hypothetical protein [Acidithiobacillus sp.]MEB8604429.1 hypothetical protein [Acidithiobacillus ferriphilus]OAP90259.1 hypothetical protein A4H96_09690 [Acidithiobacillus ferrooxidans]